MIQRIQTIYLFIVMLLAGVLPLFVSLWSNAEEGEVYASQQLWILVAYYASVLLALIAVVLYKKRKNQFVVNRLNMILNVFLLGFFVYRSLNISGESNISEKGIGMFIPVISIVFLVLANKAIKKDEDLVKSVDRLR